jgi:hypothetical protein
MFVALQDQDLTEGEISKACAGNWPCVFREIRIA